MRTEETSPKLLERLAVAGIAHVFIGWGFLRLGSLAVGALQHNGYMGLLPGLLYILPLIWIAADLARLYPGKTLTGICRAALGDYFGPAVSVLLVLQLFLITVYATRETEMMVRAYFFTQMPAQAIDLFVLGLCLYLAVHGLDAITRLASFMLIIPLAVLLTLLVFGLKNVNLMNVLPIFEGSPAQWLSAGYHYIFALSAVSALFFYVPFLSGPASVKRVGFWVLSLSVPFYFLAAFGTIGVFGPTITHQLAWPTVEFFHTLELPVILLEQAGLLFIITWLGFMLVGIATAIFFTGQELANLLPRVRRGWYCLIAAVAVFASTYLPLNVLIMDRLIHRFMWIIAFVYLPTFVLIWGAGRLRARGGTGR